MTISDVTQPGNSAAHASAVSWGAIIAGAAAAAALSLILLILGTGLGLSSISPWTNSGIGAKSFGMSTILWITLTQLLASGMGGYIAGRLRTKWAAAQADEVHFRDSAHGFLAWAVATLATATLLTSVIASIINSGVQAGATVAGGAAATAVAAAAGGAAAAGSDMSSSTRNDNGNGVLGNSMAYFLDTLLRKAGTSEAGGRNSTHTASGSMTTTNTDQSAAATTAEIGRIFMNTIHNAPMSPEDMRYAGQLVAQRTGLSQQEAEMRVQDTYARVQAKLREVETAAREAADKARKTSAYAALWLFISLLGGAFLASWVAIYGGRQRDL